MTASICSAKVSLSKTESEYPAQGRCYVSMAIEKMNLSLRVHKVSEKNTHLEGKVEHSECQQISLCEVEGHVHECRNKMYAQ